MSYEPYITDWPKYCVCASCAHTVVVDHLSDRCENCGANSTFLRYFDDGGDAEDESEEILQANRLNIVDRRYR